MTTPRASLESGPVQAGVRPGRVPGHSGLRELGRGRSGVVYLGRDGAGRRLACKVFASHGLTRVVQVLLLGSPNPYLWNEDALRCAFLRRRILARLVEHWFGARLGVAAAVDGLWNEEQRAFELQAELSSGLPLPLHRPGSARGKALVRELVTEIQAPLQRHLIESGFTGLAWQAGLGNPVALNNFLLEEEAGGARRYCWIDLESGIPALVPLDPRTLLRFYLPESWRLGRPLFDDVDVARLERYLETQASALRDRFGAEGLDALRAQAAALGRHQARWKGLARHERGIGHALARGELTAERAEWYRARPLRWYARELVRALRAALRGAGAGLARLARWLRRFPWRASARAAWLFSSSGRRRARVARHFVAGRIRAWERRRQLTRAEARRLRASLPREESSVYLTDFVVHLALKPPVKALEYWVLPLFWGLGWIGGGTLAAGLVLCGPLARSLYTAVRCAQSLRRGREVPWAALGVGLLPVVGNLAFPVQLLVSSTDERDELARFLLYDGCARLGRHVPVWGGADTLTEHVFNHLPDRLVTRSPAR
ncbi:MAG TPA: hypothetical protein VF530_20735 [Planctomycetota bacterium]